MISLVRNLLAALAIAAVAGVTPAHLISSAGSGSRKLSRTSVKRHPKDQVQPTDLEPEQGYLDPAPGGLDVKYAWTMPGGKGENVKIIDIEFNWDLNHRDLVSATSHLLVYQPGAGTNPTDDINHGTAVLGELVAADDGFGVTGISNLSVIGLIDPQINSTTLKLADSINQAAGLLDPGDVILIEQQMVGPKYNPTTGSGLSPSEFDQTVYNAIKSATLKGIVVVEPASNGSDNLDDPAYQGVFDRHVRDSGAILVGAGYSPPGAGKKADRARIGESDYGSRVDVQGWGNSVVTAGFGDIQLGPGINFSYTSKFGGTSGAAAMVAGCAALIESISKANGIGPLSPLTVRQLLAQTGTPQQGNLSQNIGPRPNLRAALDSLNSGLAEITPAITNATYNAAKGRITVDGSSFLTGHSSIEINGVAAPKVKYPAAFTMPDGSLSRITTKGDISGLVTPGTTVQITVYNSGTGLRSAPFSLRL